MSISSCLLRITFAAAFVSAIFTIVAGGKFYDDKYDNIDPHAIIANDRLRDQYYKCFVDIGPCITADARFFKKNIPEALVTKCSKCTEKQKFIMGTVVEWYVEHRPDEWKALLLKNIKDAKAANVRPA